MSPSIAPPPPDVLERILREHAHRYPEKASVVLPGGVRLPLLLGIPTGAVASDKRPEGDKVRPAWSHAVAVALKLSSDNDPTGAKLVEDCLLWPSLLQWNEWRTQWPALDSKVAGALARRLGSSLDVIRDPGEGEEPPGHAVPSSRGLWVWLSPQGADPFAVAIDPPDADAWRLFVSHVRRPGEDVAELARGLVEGCARGLPAGALDRWPGLVVALMTQVAYLAGVSADVIAGGW